MYSFMPSSASASHQHEQSVLAYLKAAMAESLAEIARLTAALEVMADRNRALADAAVHLPRPTSTEPPHDH